MPRGMEDHDREIDVESLNERGEGVCGGVAVPYALPGERVLAEIAGQRGALRVVRAASPERATPFCAHFGVCGGCATQHMGEALYRRWKRDGLVAALDRAGIEAKVAALVDAHGEGRRRVTLHVRYPHGAAPELGFMRARSHDIVAIDACPVLAPGLRGALACAAAVAQDLRGLGKPLDIQLTATLTGLDVDIRGAGPLGAPEMRKLAASAERLDVARIANHGAVVVERRAPELAVGLARLTPPPGGFLQATEAGEAKLAALAQAALRGSRAVADLHCGAGAFALRLAEAHDVHAVDVEGAALDALRRAARGAPSLRGITTEARDLAARPLLAGELGRFDAVLFDPPRAGAQAQARELAASKLPLVAAISCDAESFSRDARILVDGGFAIGEVTPIDQFRHSPHVEIFAAFSRRAARKARRIFG